MSSKHTDYTFLRGGGDMGKLIRARDWSKTQLGEPKSWPQPLRTMVGVMLDNPFGMYIAWGKDYTQIYNDGYRPILGATKHPQALGISTRETFSEIWHIIGSMFDGVMNGEAVGFPDFMLPLDRNGYVENCYFDFAYSPIRLENGEVGGVLVTVIETTAKKNAQEDLKESKHELEFVIETAQLGTFDYNPLTNKFSGNNRLKKWFGLPPDDQIALAHALKVIAENDRDRVSQAIKDALDSSSGGIYDVKYTIINPISQKEIIVHAKGRVWFNDDKIAYRMNGTLEDITEETLANRKTKKTEQHIRTMVLESPVGICVMDANTLVSEIVNDSFVEIAGKPRSSIIGKYYWETFAEARAYYENALQKVVESGEAFYANEVELMLIRHGKEETIYVTFVYAPLKDEDDKVVKIAVWMLENTVQVEARKKIMVSENNLRLMILQAPVAIAIFRGTDYRVEIANKFALEIWGRTEAQVLNTPLFESMPELITQGIKEFLEEVTSTGNRFATPEMPVRFERNGVLERVYLNFSFEALYDPKGTINGIMAIGIDVTPQVEARKKVEESEQSIRALVESAPFPIGVFVGDEMRISLANQSIMDAWGKGNDVIGKLYSDILPEFGNQQIFEQIGQVLHTGIPFHAKNQKVDIVKKGQSNTFYYNYSFTPLMDGSGNTYAVMNTAAEVTELHEAKQKVEEALSEIKLFKFMADTAADPFILMEEDGSFPYLNNMALTKWGYTEEEMKLLKVPDVDIIYNDKKFREAFKRAQNEILPPFETKHKNKLGDIYPVEINMGSVRVDEKNLLFAVARDITERKKAEQDVIEAFQKVEESEKRFRDSVKQAPFGIVIFRGPENVTEMANENYLQIIDKTEKQFVGKPLFETLPEVEETIATIIEDIYKTGKAFYGYEFPVNLNRHGKTETTYFNFVYHPLKENNIITGIMAVATEVTATVKAKHLIEENEEKLKLIIEASELGIWDLDLKTQNMIASERCYEILGFPNTKKSLTPKKIITHVHPDDISLRTEAFEKAMESGSLNYQIRIIWEDHSLHWKDVKGKVFYDQHNKPDRMLGTVRDITEERNFHQQLLEREEKFRLLADSMPQYIWTADPEGNLNYFNQSLYDYTGFSPGELHNEDWVKMVHPDDRAENIRQWLHSVNTGEDYLFEQRFRKHNGDYRWQLSRAIPQKDAHGVIKRWVGTSTDIQEQKMFTTELENQVQQRTNELQQKNMDLENMNKELQSFVYISSHDLQEPLRKIQTFASRILDTEYDTLSENAKKHFGRMQQSAHRMQNLIQDLVAYSRTNVKDITFEIVDLQEIIEDVKETLSEELEQNDVSFILNNICEVKIIPVQFTQVILNLVTNSIKFSKVGEPNEINIDCEIIEGKKTGITILSGKKQFCHIRFADKGIGFEQQYNEKIFEVFQRLHSKEEFMGTGIGLAIVKRIIENHDGIILATGGINQGAVFDIYIPAH